MNFTQWQYHILPSELKWNIHLVCMQTVASLASRVYSLSVGRALSNEEKAAEYNQCAIKASGVLTQQKLTHNTPHNDLCGTCNSKDLTNFNKSLAECKCFFAMRWMLEPSSSQALISWVECVRKKRRRDSTLCFKKRNNIKGSFIGLQKPLDSGPINTVWTLNRF